MTSEILVRTSGQVGHISLNRPRALNALTQEMCETMSNALLQWRSDPAIAAVIIDHGEGRGFCAGGDVAMVRASALADGGAAGRAFFHAEYRLNHLLFSYPKPVVTFMDGVTMGGGVGISLPARFRVATANTLFAMPEGAIGLFPDVGAGWYLPRLPGEIGKFLALTGARLDGAECLWAGLATHYCDAARLTEVKLSIAESPRQIAEICGKYSADPPPARLAGNAERIGSLFAPATLEGILGALAADPSDWAAKEHRAVAEKCPASAKVALRLFAQSAALPDFAAEMAREYRLAARMLARADFAEGVRAVLIDKDNAPRWQPGAPDGVTEAMLDAIFAPLAPGEEWTPYTAA
jgi:enoyl-CoA hydratase